MVGCLRIREYLLLYRFATPYIHAIQGMPADSLYTGRKLYIPQTYAAGNRFQDANTSFLPGVEVADQDDRSPMVPECCLELQHLIKEWPS